MSTSFKNWSLGLSCGNETGWRRLASWWSFWFRNGVLVVGLLVLWWWEWLGWWLLPIIVALVVGAAWSMWVPRARRARGWHYTAIMGERYLVCHGLGAASGRYRTRLVILKLCDGVAVVAIGYALVVGSVWLYVGASVGFFLIRLMLLACTRSIFLNCGKQSEPWPVGGYNNE